ncbi:MAG: response regulator, partial [Leptolyngbyaceae cyanobacterium bins.59]|nr:response regulator [Leptolyngbyaceae cyanobacterium bins.59]
GVGSQFILTLPVKQAAMAYPSLLPRPNRVIGLAPGQPQFRILVVDDQPDNRRLVKQVMLFLGLEVWEASNGTEAIQRVERERPDLIWMDIRMPEMDGYEATKRIRALPGGPPPIIIAITAQVTAGGQQQALASGFNDYVGKPCQEQVLFDKLANHLGLKYLYAAPEDELAHFSEAFSIPEEVLAHLPALTSDLLSTLPKSWLPELETAVLHCDEPRLYQLIQQIPEKHSLLAHSLAHFVNDFRFEEILQFTRSYQPQESAER